MVAQTLFESKDQLLSRIADLEAELLESKSYVAQFEQNKDNLSTQLQETLSQMQTLEMVKDDYEKTIQALTTKKNRSDNKNEILTTKNAQL